MTSQCDLFVARFYQDVISLANEHARKIGRPDISDRLYDLLLDQTFSAARNFEEDRSAGADVTMEQYFNAAVKEPARAIACRLASRKKNGKCGQIILDVPESGTDIGLQTLLEQVSPTTRAFILLSMKGYTTKEIAKRLGASKPFELRYSCIRECERILDLKPTRRPTGRHRNPTRLQLHRKRLQNPPDQQGLQAMGRTG